MYVFIQSVSRTTVLVRKTHAVSRLPSSCLTFKDPSSAIAVGNSPATGRQQDTVERQKG